MSQTESSLPSPPEATSPGPPSTARHSQGRPASHEARVSKAETSPSSSPVRSCRTQCTVTCPSQSPERMVGSPDSPWRKAATAVTPAPSRLHAALPSSTPVVASRASRPAFPLDAARTAGTWGSSLAKRHKDLIPSLLFGSPHLLTTLHPSQSVKLGDSTTLRSPSSSDTNKRAPGRLSVCVVFSTDICVERLVGFKFGSWTFQFNQPSLTI
mmetsp:Transcript_12779/g.30296  ORF Transcript_12779/g.30296 Transcript_12779/m.30296 type:complete len:212 (+) Transcript_12779:1764-2399(+)